MADVTDSQDKLTGNQNIQIGLFYGMKPMAEIAIKYKQTALASSLQKKYETLAGRFSRYYGSGPQ